MAELKKGRAGISDAEVEEEIEKLKESPMVRLARKEQRLQYKRRQVLYSLRAMEKRGRELTAMGYTIDTIGSEFLDVLDDDLNL